MALDRHDLGYVPLDRWQASRPTLRGAYAQSGYGQSATQLYRSMLDQWNRQGMQSGHLKPATTGTTSASATSGADAYGIKDAIDKANAANEARYGEGKAIMDQRIAAAEGYGAQQKADVNQNFNSAWGGIQQQLASRGLGSSSLMASGAMGNERERAAALNRVGENVTRYKNELLADKENLIRSKSDNAPSWDQYLQLMSQAGYGSGGGGGRSYGGSYGGSMGMSSGSNQRARPWSPNWNMGQGMQYNDAVAAAGGMPTTVASGGYYGGYAPTQKMWGTTQKKSTVGFWDKAKGLAASFI